MAAHLDVNAGPVGVEEDERDEGRVGGKGEKREEEKGGEDRIWKGFLSCAKSVDCLIKHASLVCRFYFWFSHAPSSALPTRGSLNLKMLRCCLAATHTHTENRRVSFCRRRHHRLCLALSHVTLPEFQRNV